jgi:hypothetical protein
MVHRMMASGREMQAYGEKYSYYGLTSQYLRTVLKTLKDQAIIGFLNVWQIIPEKPLSRSSGYGCI